MGNLHYIDGVALSTHIVLSEFINGDLRLHEMIVENNDFPAEGSLFLLVVLWLECKRKNGQVKRETGEKQKEKNPKDDRVDDKMRGRKWGLEKRDNERDERTKVGGATEVKQDYKGAQEKWKGESHKSLSAWSWG